MKFSVLSISILTVIIRYSVCSISMCFHCTLRRNSITFNCKIDDLHLPVYIQDNFGKEVARCGIPFPYPLCTATYSNTTVEQNLYTNETVVGVRGNIDDSLNGNWSCHHGFGTIYTAVVEINVPALQVQIKTEKYDDLRCLKEISFYTLTGVVISLVMIGVFWLIMKGTCKSNKGEEQDFKYIVFPYADEIDECFKVQRLQKYSLRSIKIFFFICLVLLVVVAGSLISILEKDACSGSFAFIILGISLCLTLIILFCRERASTHSNINNNERENHAHDEDAAGLNEGGEDNLEHDECLT